MYNGMQSKYLIQVIVIDPYKKELSWQTIDNNCDPQKFTYIMQCRNFDVVRLGDNVIMYVDDEGLLKNPNSYFSFVTNDVESQGYAGIAILATTNSEGDTLSFDKDIGEVRSILHWKPEGYSEEPYMEFIPLDDKVLH